MSVIARTPSGALKLLCKGADTTVLERIGNETTSELLINATMQHLDKFAAEGLRTLCVAYKNIEEHYCGQWLVSMPLAPYRSQRS